MDKLSRRVFSGTLLSASAAAAQEPSQADTAALDFPEWLPGLFERTIEIQEWSGRPSLRWIFTGPHGGFTVEVSDGKLRLAVRYYDSPGLSNISPDAPRSARHPERLVKESTVSFGGDLKAVTIFSDHQLTTRILLNGREVLAVSGIPDVNRHQLAAGWAVQCEPDRQHYGKPVFPGFQPAGGIDHERQLHSGEGARLYSLRLCRRLAAYPQPPPDRRGHQPR